MKKYDDAIYYLDAVTQTQKNYIFAFYNLIKIYLLKKNTNDAYLVYKEFTDVIKTEERNSPVAQRLSVTSHNALKLFYKLGAECCFAKALYQECVHTILEALKFNPEDPGKKHFNCT